ncbi:hypothetical protein [Paraburkholderia sprentiae]|uniref:hypothetical protein n=1 Tax=Paraburkholderia sprentiae TaxID=948107 RepID=UPI0004280C2D|nr:hypothetical protein [Paraburkholderia sprentiae]
MSGREFSERAKARKWAREHPLRGPVRRALFEILCEIIDGDRVFHAGVRWLAWRIGSNHTSVQNQINEFRDRELIVFIDRKGRGGTKRYRLDYERSVELYPDSVTLEQFRLMNPAEPEVFSEIEHFEQAEVFSEVEYFDAPKCSTSGTEVFNLMGPKCSTSGTEVFNFSGRSVQRDCTKGFEVNTQCETQGKTERPSVAGRAVGFASQSSTSHSPPAGHEHEADKADGIAALAQAMIDQFDTYCEAKDHDAVEDAFMHFARRGARVDDLHEAISTAQRQCSDGRKPRLTAVRNALDILLGTRESVIDHSCRYDEETRQTAQQLEAIFARYLDKPSRNAGSSRVHMAEWLCWCVSNDNVDEVTFEAACREAAKKINSKTPQWKTARAALDARVRARDDGKDFLTGPPARRAPACRVTTRGTNPREGSHERPDDRQYGTTDDEQPRDRGADRQAPRQREAPDRNDGRARYHHIPSN